MSTQLRLVDTPTTKAARKARKARATATAGVTPRARAVHWSGDWRLDSTTRRVGRQGVAAARAALERAARPDAPLSKAS